MRTLTTLIHQQDDSSSFSAGAVLLLAQAGHEQREAVLAAGGLDAFVALLSNNTTAAMQKHAAAVVHVLASDAEIRQQHGLHLGAGLGGGLSRGESMLMPLVNMTRGNQQDAELETTVMMAIGSLCGAPMYESDTMHVTGSVGLPPLFRAAEQVLAVALPRLSHHDERVRFAAVRCLASMTAEAATSRKMLESNGKVKSCTQSHTQKRMQKREEGLSYPSSI